MVGVNYDLFWVLNPKTLTPFIKAFSLRQQYDDKLSWQLGQYIQVAIASVMSKETKYPSKPFLATVDAPKETQQEMIKRKFMEKMELLNTRFGEEVDNG